jgi:hypothetical protein
MGGCELQVRFGKKKKTRVADPRVHRYSFELLDPDPGLQFHFKFERKGRKNIFKNEKTPFLFFSDFSYDKIEQLNS